MSGSLKGTYATEGFTILRKIFPRELVASTCDVLHDALANKESYDHLSLDELILERESQDHSLVYQASLCVGSSAAAYKLMASTNLVEIMSELSGVSPRHMHFMPLAIQIQLPGDKRFDYKWHQESTFYPWCEDVLSVWFPLLRHSKADDGTMVVIPKSHQAGKREANSYFSYGRIRQIEPDIAKQEADTEVPVEIDVGDACAFDANLVHRSQGNAAQLPRVTGIIRVANYDSMARIRPLYKALSINEADAVG